MVAGKKWWGDTGWRMIRRTLFSQRLEQFHSENVELTLLFRAFIAFHNQFSVCELYCEVSPTFKQYPIACQ